MNQNYPNKSKICYLLVTIDTEEDMPKWRPEPVTTVKNIQSLPAIHEKFQAHHIRPTYLVDRPVLSDETSCKTIDILRHQDTCEIGMHLHSWNTPPFMNEEYYGKATVLNLYSKEIQEKKITGLHEYFKERLGFAPTSYRAGRYGLTSESVEILAKLGYVADSSIVPFTDYSSYGAPDYRQYDFRPFWIKTSDSYSLLEIPVTSALVTQFPRNFYDLYFSIPEWTHIRGVMHRLNLARLLWLRPTSYTYKEMRQLADFIVRKSESPIFNIMFHSSELCPGTSPYNLTEKDVTAFTERLFKITQYIFNEYGAESVTLSEFAKIVKNNADTFGYHTKPLV